MKYNPPTLYILQIQGDLLLAGSTGNISKEKNDIRLTPETALDTFDGTLEGDAKESGSIWDEWED